MKETFEAFTRRVPNFFSLSHTDKICHAAWYLHTVRGQQYVTTASINSLFDDIHTTSPPTAVYLKRMAEKKPPMMIKSKIGYRLENKPRLELERKLGLDVPMVVVSAMLSELTSKISRETEARFLDETLKCYSVGAFRAAIVMAWNLAFDHLVCWILGDRDRLLSFNASVDAKYPRKKVVVDSFDHFADFKEYEVIESVVHAKLVSKNVGEILKEKLKRRNAAAHPSSLVITRAQADDVLTDLVNNVVVKLRL